MPDISGLHTAVLATTATQQNPGAGAPPATTADGAPVPPDNGPSAQCIALDTVAGGAAVVGTALIGGGLYALLRPRVAAQSDKIVLLPTNLPRNLAGVIARSGMRPVFDQGRGTATCGMCSVLTMTHGGSRASDRDINQLRANLLKIRNDRQVELRKNNFSKQAADLENLSVPDATDLDELIELHNYETALMLREARADGASHIPAADLLQHLDIRFIDKQTHTTGPREQQPENRQVGCAEDSLGYDQLARVLPGVDAAGNLPRSGRTFAVLTAKVAKLPAAVQGDELEKHWAAVADKTGPGHWVVLTHEPHVVAGADQSTHGWFLLDSDGQTARKLLHLEYNATIGGAQQALRAYLGEGGGRLEQLGVKPSSETRAYLRVAAPNSHTVPDAYKKIADPAIPLK